MGIVGTWRVDLLARWGSGVSLWDGRGIFCTDWVFVHLTYVLSSAWIWTGAVLLVCVLRVGRFVGVGQVGHGFWCVNWTALIDLFWRARPAAPHAIVLIFVSISLASYSDGYH